MKGYYFKTMPQRNTTSPDDIGKIIAIDRITINAAVDLDYEAFSP